VGALRGEARFFFLNFAAKGGIIITAHAHEIALVVRELAMWRKDHRIPPFAKTKTAKDGAPSCVVAPAKGGASNVGELILEFYNSSHAVGNLFISPAGALQDAKPSDPSHSTTNSSVPRT